MENTSNNDPIMETGRLKGDFNYVVEDKRRQINFMLVLIQKVRKVSWWDRVEKNPSLGSNIVAIIYVIIRISKYKCLGQRVEGRGS